MMACACGNELHGSYTKVETITHHHCGSGNPDHPVDLVTTFAAVWCATCTAAARDALTAAAAVRATANADEEIAATERQATIDALQAEWSVIFDACQRVQNLLPQLPAADARNVGEALQSVTASRIKLSAAINEVARNTAAN